MDEIKPTDKQKQATQAVATPSSEERILAFEHTLNKLHDDVRVLEENHRVLSTDLEKETTLIATLEKKLAPTLAHEEKVLALIKEVSGKERVTKDVSERRTHEAARWKYIEEWYAVEQEKWVTQEDLEAQRTRLAENKKKLDFLIESERSLRSEIATIETEVEKEKLHSALNAVVVQRVETEKKLADLTAARENVLHKFEAIGARETDVEKKESDVEELLHSARSLSDERELSEKRYALEKERHEIESSRWGIEDDMARLGTSAVDAEKHLTELKTKEAAIAAELEALEVKKGVPSSSASPSK